MERLEQAKKEGHYTVLLSSSPDFIVEAFAKFLNVDAYGASVYQVNDKGLFDEVKKVMDGENKRNFVEELSKRLKISRNEVIGYSDSYLDLLFLEGVGKAVAVNPDKILKGIASRKGWEII